MYFHGVQCRISICTHIIERLNQMSEYIHGCAEFVINLSFFVVSMFKKIYSFSNLKYIIYYHAPRSPGSNSCSLAKILHPIFLSLGFHQRIFQALGLGAEFKIHHCP